MITKKLFKIVLLFSIFAFGNFLLGMIGPDGDVLTPEEVAYAKRRYIGKMRQDFQDEVNVNFYERPGFSRNFERALKLESRCRLKNVSKQIAWLLGTTVSTCTVSLIPDSCYKRLLKLCGSPFKSFAIVLAGAAVIGYGVGKLSKWVIDKFADRASKEKQAIVENFAKQISPLTAGAMVGIIYTSPTQISTVSSRLLNRPFKNDREVYYAKNILLDIWKRDNKLLS